MTPNGLHQLLLDLITAWFVGDVASATGLVDQYRWAREVGGDPDPWNMDPFYTGDSLVSRVESWLDDATHLESIDNWLSIVDN